MESREARKAKKHLQRAQDLLGFGTIITNEYMYEQLRAHSVRYELRKAYIEYFMSSTYPKTPDAFYHWLHNYADQEVTDYLHLHGQI